MVRTDRSRRRQLVLLRKNPAEEDSNKRSSRRSRAPSFRPPSAKGWEAASGLLGKKVSHYRVLEIIGGGGMGLVYKAEDLKLGRRVALKFLPEELVSDPIALQRFEREAQTASSLNHPNICYIHEFGEHQGQPFLAMELLEGETLRDRLAADATGPPGIPLDELLKIAMQVADGLEAAHEQGIIHRDIKPANIFLTRKGTAKILDFGLAKLASTGQDPGTPHSSKPGLGGAPSQFLAGVILSEERSDEPKDPHPGTDLNPIGVPIGVPRLVAPKPGPLARDDSVKIADLTLTRTGLAMGTAGYMSPEQVRGEKLDARTDLFSFGLVLYEMACGQRAFTGETAAILKDAILNRTAVPVRELNSTLPPKLEKIINKALEKDRERRYQSATQMRGDLQVIAEGRVAPRRVGSALPRRRLALALVAVLLLAAILGSALYWRSHRPVHLTEKDTLVVADFANSTGDQVFEGTLKQALAMELEQSPFLNVLPEQKISATLKLMNRPAGEHLTFAHRLANYACARTGGPY